MERNRLLFGRQRLGLFLFLPADVGFAEHLDVTAKRNGADFPAGVVLIGPTEDFRTEADGKHLDPHSAAARDPVVAPFVDEHQDRQHDQENHDVIEGEVDDTHVGSLFQACRKPMPVKYPKIGN